MRPEDVRISVVMPSWNSRRFLQQALESVFAQSHPPFEVIVQDAGSTDGTLELVVAYGSRVQCVSGPDFGQSDAVNRAVARASGDLIAWLNADDIYLPEAFAAAAAAYVNAGEPDLVFGDWDMIDADGSVFRRYRPADFSWERLFASGCYLFSAATFFRRDLFERFGGLNVNLHYTMDLEYFLRIGRSVRAQRVPQSLAQLRIHDDNKSTKLKWRFVRESHGVLWAYVGWSPRRLAQVLYADTRKFAYILLTPLRFSRTWSHLRMARRTL